MAEEAEEKADEPAFAETIGRSATRKIRAKREGKHVWSGLGLMGMVGWSVAVPTLVGVFIGQWLDAEHPDDRSWTLVCLAAGLLLGCANAWRWVSKENAYNRDIDHNGTKHKERK